MERTARATDLIARAPIPSCHATVAWLVVIACAASLDPAKSKSHQQLQQMNASDYSLLESHDLEHWSSLISGPLCWTKYKADVARPTKNVKRLVQLDLSSPRVDQLAIECTGCIRQAAYGSSSVDFLRQCKMMRNVQIPTSKDCKSNVSNWVVQHRCCSAKRPKPLLPTHRQLASCLEANKS